MCLEQVSWPEPNEKNEIHSDWSVFVMSYIMLIKTSNLFVESISYAS